MTAQAGRMSAVQTAQGAFTADRFVIATGAWSGSTLPGLPAAPNIRPIRGQMLLFKLEPGALDTILYRQGLYLIPRRDGHVLMGSTLEDAGFDKSTDEATRSRLHNAAAELLPPLADVQPVQHWAGLRPGSPDNIPIIGMMVLVFWFTYLGFREGRKHDQLIDAGRRDEVLKEMQK